MSAPVVARDRAPIGRPLGGDFDDLPAAERVRAFGVDYAHLRPPEGGDLYVTRHGWPRVATLMPSRWYADEWYVRHGVRLPGSTGHVYRTAVRPGEGGTPDLVVKFSRVAQDVPVVIASSFPDQVPPEVLAEARFNSPMEEFGLVTELRESDLGPPGLRVLTQRPLAIYTPPEQFDLWQLGRSTSSFDAHRLLLAEDQDQAVRAIELDIRRIYVVLYGWIAGSDAETCFELGELSEPELAVLTSRVIGELAAKGFRVLDNKPRHFILRRRKRDGALMRRPTGELVYGLVDFELLQRTPESQRRFHAARREAYWRLLARRPTSPPAVPAWSPVTVFGVDYVFGATPDGGSLWVVGNEPGLFDYFLPDRWRRTERVKLSARSDVFGTRTRDHIDVVYRLSRVGLRPLADPLSAGARRIREAGYNSPFEEVAIAERLREMGVPTTRPRAIYRTGHTSSKAMRLRDPRRFAGHAGLLTPESSPVPILQPEFDYYTVWDTYRGLDPVVTAGPGGVAGVLGLQRACDDGLITEEERRTTFDDARRRLASTALPADSMAEDEFAVCLDPTGAPARDGALLRVVLSLDALTALEFDLIGEELYLAILRRMAERLRAVDFEKLDPSGRHLLLTVDPDGRVRRDASGEAHAVLCNFALVHGLYRPIR